MRIKLKPLRKQTVVIADASSGIGLATARRAARKGARVVLAARDEDAIRRLADEIRAGGGRAIHVATDVGRADDAERLARIAIKVFGGFDTWVNNAGFPLPGGADEVASGGMKHFFDSSYWGVVHGSRAALRHFLEKRRPGSVITVGAAFGGRAAPVQSAYSASRHALRGWTDGLRVELEKDRVPVSITLVHPGRVENPYNEHARHQGNRQPAPRGIIHPPETIARAILHAAAHPQRDVYVGSPSRIAAALSILFPRLSAQRTEKTRDRSRGAGTGRSMRPGDDALFEPCAGMHEGDRNEPRIRRPNGLHLIATKRPWVTVALGLAVTAGVMWSRARPIRSDVR